MEWATIFIMIWWSSRQIMRETGRKKMRKQPMLAMGRWRQHKCRDRIRERRHASQSSGKATKVWGARLFDCMSMDRSMRWGIVLLRRAQAQARPCLNIYIGWKLIGCGCEWVREHSQQRAAEACGSFPLPACLPLLALPACLRFRLSKTFAGSGSTLRCAIIFFLYLKRSHLRVGVLIVWWCRSSMDSITTTTRTLCV